MEKFWMIVNIADSTGEHNGDKIPASQAPRFMHLSRPNAELELLRLQGKYPHGEFVLLEAVALAKPQQQTVLVVEAIEVDDEIPF